MARTMQWHNVKDSRRSVETGTYAVEIENLTARYATTSGSYMINAEFRVVAPVEVAGFPLFESYTIGTKDDKEAEQAETWANSVGARIFKSMLQAARATLHDSDEATFAGAQGKLLVVDVVRGIEPEKKWNGEPNPRAGRPNYEIKGYHAVADKMVPGLDVAAATNGAGAAGPGVDCPTCHAAVPAADFGTHVLAHRTGTTAKAKK